VDGILLIDKPSGWTSFDVVAKVRGIIKHETGLKKPKVGHAGTLDPLATGLLVVLVGKYCKRAQEFSKLDKTYQITMELGVTSTTGDEEGEKIQVSDEKPSEEDVLATLEHFTAEMMQTPHAFSAIKVNGQRAYKLARAGKAVMIEPRSVTIYEITDAKYAYPKIKFTAKVSSGTYIRSLVEDIGKKLEIGAYLSALRRTQVGTFGIEQAVSITELNSEQINSYIKLA
jgi:tRNA pseudouridine55 synthase